MALRGLVAMAGRQAVSNAQINVERIAEHYDSIANACPAYGKVRYRKRAQAQSVAGRINRERPRKGTRASPAVAYECAFCGYWHVGRSRREGR